MSDTPSFQQALASAFESQLGEINVSMPGRVESYDPTTLAVSVQPLIKRTVRGESDDEIIERLPIINGVPVLFLGSGSSRTTYPIQKGDVVLLVFSHTSLDKWLALGGEVDPEDARHHSINDAIAIPGLSSFRSARAASILATVIEASQLQLGGQAAVDSIIKGTAFMSAFTTWLGVLTTYIQIPVPTAPQTLVWTTAHNLFVGLLTSFLSTKVKTE